MTMAQCESWSWRLALLTLPLGTAWIFSFGVIGDTPWAMGNVGVGVGEFFVVLALICAAVRGGMRCSRPAAYIALAWLGLLLGRGLATSFPVVSALCVMRYAMAALLLITTISLSAPEIRKWWGMGMLIPCVFALLEVFVWHGVPASTLFGMASHPLLAPGTSVIEVAGERFMRAYGTFSHPNIFGAYLVVSVIMLTRNVEIRISKFATILLVLAGFCLALTFSRAALLAFVIVCLLERTRVLPAFAGCLIGILLFLPAYGVRIGSQPGRLETVSTEQRVASLRDGWGLFREQPLVGVGAMQSVPTLVMSHAGSIVWDFEPPHMVPLLMLAEWGIVGALFAIAAFFLLIVPLAPLFCVLIPLVILGAFDHALLTSSSLLLLVPLALSSVRNRYVAS